MAKCEAAKTMKPGEFHSHISDLVDEIANCVHVQIQNAVRDAAHDVQNTMKQGDPLTSEQKKEIDVWQENLGTDITTIDAEASWGDDRVRGLIESHVRNELGRLPARAGSLPDPNKTAGLMDKLKTNLYGSGYGDTEGNGPRGLLGDASDEAHSLRTYTLKNWDGATATSFKTDFLDDADLVIQRQREDLNTLAHFVDVCLGVATSAREDLDEIAHGGLIAAENMADTCGHGADGNEEGVDATLGTIGAAATIASGFASGNFAVAATAAAGAATFYRTLVEEEQHEYRSFGAANWKELIRKIAEVTDEVENEIDEAYDSIQSAASKRIEEVSDKKIQFYTVKAG